MDKEISQEKNAFGERIKETVLRSLVDGTAINAELTPLYAAFETSIAGMSYETSRNARLVGAAMGYAGIGFVYGKMRDAWRNRFGIDDKTKESVQKIHDAACTAIFSAVISPPLYLAAGSRDWKEIALGTACSAGVSLINGIPLGYTVDLFRDLTCFKKSERIPELLRNQNSKTKKGLAALLVAGSLALTSAIYSANFGGHVDGLPSQITTVN